MKVEFLRSSSPAFKMALQIARHAPVYQESEGIHTAEFNDDTIPAFSGLIHLVCSWRTTRISVKGQQIRPSDNWKLAAVFDCYMKRSEFPDPEAYCFTGWLGSTTLFPCHMIHLHSMWEIQTGHQYGELDRQKHRHVDKDQIAREVEHSLRMEMALYCPALDMIMIDAIIQEIPAVISSYGDVPEPIWKFNKKGNLEKLLGDVPGLEDL